MAIGSFVKELFEKTPNFPFRETLRTIERRWRGSPGRLYRNFRPVNSTRPLRCNPAAETEIHTLTCHKHVFMYITAIKSLLRFVSDVAVVVHDDGSLTPTDIATIEKHIEGIRVIRRGDADQVMASLLASCPKTAEYRSKVVNSLELTDHALLANKEKLIITNSDTLFLQRPEEVIQWIAADRESVLCVYEKEPYQQAEFLNRLGSPFPPHLTFALVCLRKSLVEPAEIEKYMSLVEPADSPWYVGQNLLPVLLGGKLSADKIEFLDKQKYEASAEFRDGAVFRHYWTSLANLRPQFFSDAGAVIADLKSRNG